MSVADRPDEARCTPPLGRKRAQNLDLKEGYADDGMHHVARAAHPRFRPDRPVALGPGQPDAAPAVHEATGDSPGGGQPANRSEALLSRTTVRAGEGEGPSMLRGAGRSVGAKRIEPACRTRARPLRGSGLPRWMRSGQLLQARATATAAPGGSDSRSPEEADGADAGDRAGPAAHRAGAPRAFGAPGGDTDRFEQRSPGDFVRVAQLIALPAVGALRAHRIGRSGLPMHSDC